MLQGRVSLIFLPPLGRVQQCISWSAYVLSPNIMILNTDKKQGHPLGNQSRNLLICHKHMLYYCVELEAVIYLQMSSNWLSRKPEVLICRVCHLCKYSHQV